VADIVAVILLGNADLSAGDDGAGQRGTKQVAVLIDGIALDGTEDDLLDELALEVLNDHALSAKGESLLLNLSPVLLLADVGEEAHDGVALVQAVRERLSNGSGKAAAAAAVTSRMSHFRMVEVSRPGIWMSVLCKSGRSKTIEIRIHATATPMLNGHGAL